MVLYAALFPGALIKDPQFELLATVMKCVKENGTIQCTFERPDLPVTHAGINFFLLNLPRSKNHRKSLNIHIFY